MSLLSLSEATGIPAGEGIRVLVLEDNPTWAELVARVLKRGGQGVEVVLVPTLAAARVALHGAKFNIALVDLNVPDSQGLGTLDAMRALNDKMAIVVMTGESDERLAFQALRGGAQDYLIKGDIDAANLIRTCRYALERRAAELDLTDSHQLLVRTLDGLPTCIAILDEEGVIQAVNHAWSSFQDARHPFIYDCPVGTNYLVKCDQVHGDAEGLHFIAQQILLVLAAEYPLRRMDYAVGTEEDQAWYELVVTRSATPQGTSIVVSHLDISERKDLEKRLRVSEELFTIISHNVPDLMAIVDAEGRRHYNSPSYMSVLGYTAEELAELPGTALLHPDDLAKVAEGLAQLFTSGQNHNLEYRMRHKDGSWRTFDSNGTLITNVQSRVPQALVVARDITDRKVAEQMRELMEVQLRQAQKLEAIGQLAAGIAHEINTPTQFIGDNATFLRNAITELMAAFRDVEARLRGCLTQAQDTAGLEAVDRLLGNLDVAYLEKELPRAIEQSLDGVARVTRIVSAMKDFSHPSTNQKVPTDLNRAIESTLTVSRNEWKYVADLELDLDPDLPPVPCFPGEFNQVILNLVVNAAHAIEEALGGRSSGRMGRIRVVTRRQGDSAVVEIKDTGPGIPDAIRDRIFDPFFTTKPVGKGTGQGLAIAHSVIVDKHGGRITVESQPGLGSSFILHLPLGRGNTEADTEAATEGDA